MSKNLAEQISHLNQFPQGREDVGRSIDRINENRFPLLILSPFGTKRVVLLGAIGERNYVVFKVQLVNKEVAKVYKRFTQRFFSPNFPVKRKGEVNQTQPVGAQASRVAFAEPLGVEQVFEQPYYWPETGNEPGALVN